MIPQPRKRVTGRWEVRWRQGGRRRSRTFDRKDDADTFAVEVGRRLQLGHLVQLEDVTLADEMLQWWRLYAIPNLARSTQDTYMQIWNKHLLGRLGGYNLRDLTPLVIEDYRAQLHAKHVGDPTVIKAMGLLQAILKRAVVQGRLEINPVQAVDKPTQRRSRFPVPLSPLVVERIRLEMNERDATLVSVMAYAGLRPQEAINLTWDQVGSRGLAVYAPKTNTKRIVTLLAPLAADLRAWKLASGGRHGLVFPGAGGREWTRAQWQNWRRRTYQGTQDRNRDGELRHLGAARRAGVTGDMRPYRLRSSFVSLLLWEGRSVAYVAQQAGHDVATLAAYYAGVLEETSDGVRVSAETAVEDARREALEATG